MPNRTRYTQISPIRMVIIASDRCQRYWCRISRCQAHARWLIPKFPTGTERHFRRGPCENKIVGKPNANYPHLPVVLSAQRGEVWPTSRAAELQPLILS